MLYGSQLHSKQIDDPVRLGAYCLLVRMKAMPLSRSPLRLVPEENTLQRHRSQHGVPQVSPHVFAEAPDSAYWVGIVADPSGVSHEEYFVGAARLRAQVYVDELALLPPERLDSDGCEWDADDARAVHFVVLEKGPDSRYASLVGTSRLILKGSDDGRLPIELLFPAVFEGSEAEPGSVEVSRFISRHEKKSARFPIALALIRALTFEALRRRARTAYFVVERPLWTILRRLGLPMRQLAPETTIPEYGNTANMAVAVTPEDIEDIVRKGRDSASEGGLLEAFFRKESDGLGFYPRSLIRG